MNIEHEDQELDQLEGLRSAADGRWVVLGRLQIVEKDDGGELDVPLAHVLEQRDKQKKKVAEIRAVLAQEEETLRQFEEAAKAFKKP